jgi:polysaccharide biosynthesis/export protein
MRQRPTQIILIFVTCLLLIGAQPLASQEASTRAAAGQTTSATAGTQEPSSPSSPTHQGSGRYTVHTSDTLELTFMLTPDFNQTVTVQPDGYITLRQVGEVSAAGQTLAELTESVKRAYGKILHEPALSIDPKDFEKPYFLVGGQVGRPGKFDWRGDLTLTQALTIAGGFNDNAKHSQVLLFRRVSDQWAEAKLIDVKRMLRTGNLQEDLVLQPGDMVYVPKNAISKIKPYIPIPTLGLYSNQF